MGSSVAIPVQGATQIIINEIEPSKQEEEQKQAAATYEDDGEGNHDLPDDLVKALKDLLQHYGTVVDKVARRQEVIDARRQRHYDRGNQYIYYDGRSYTFVPVTGGVVMNVGNESVQMPRYTNVYNIYKPYRRNYTATLVQNPPGVNFEPVDPTNGLDIKSAEAAEAYSQHYDAVNNPKELQGKIARLFWTDGRVVGWTTHRKNKKKDVTFQDKEDQEQAAKEAADAGGTGEGAGASGGAESNADTSSGEQPDAEPDPGGEEVTKLYGVIEAKVFPITADSQEELLGMILHDDPEINIAKEEYDWIAEEIKAGEGGAGEEAFERNCRLGVLQGSKMYGQSKDAHAHLAERKRMFLRPAAFNRNKDHRDRLKEIFPKGVEVVFVSGEYAESWNCDLDTCLTVKHALDGDGMNRPSWGYDLVPVQNAYNNYRNMRQEYHDYGIPWVAYDVDIFDPQSIREFISQPGELKGAVNPQPGTPLGEYFFESTAATPPADMIQAEQDLRDALAQLITGVQPSLFGGNLAAGKEADRVGVYQMAREQAMAVMILPWGVIQAMFADFKYQAALAAGAARRAEAKIHVMPQKQRGLKKKPISVSIADLTVGKFRCIPNADSSFPATRQMRKQAYQEIMAAAEAHPMLQEAAMQPDNMELGAQLEGLPEFDVPAARAWKRQKDEIDELLSTTPIPPSLQQLQAAELAASAKMAMQASAAGQKAPELPPEQKAPTEEEYAVAIATGKWTPQMVAMATCSLEPDPEDFHQYHRMSIKDFFNSPERDKAVDAGNMLGILNLRLHAALHDKFIEQEAAKNQGQQKPVSKSMNFKDLPPELQAQMAAEAGYQLTPIQPAAGAA